jgi:hypothetical protein
MDDDSDGGMTPDKWIKLVSTTASVLRKLRLGRLVEAVKTRAQLPLIREYHENVVHPLRCLAVAMNDVADPKATAYHAQRVCTEIAKVMRFHLGIRQNELHCCWKVIQPKQNLKDLTFIRAIARSEPRDHRPDDEETRPAEQSTVYCSLMGLQDGTTVWKPFSCFCSNNLPGHGHLFHSGRSNWQEYYKSSLVFPLRFIQKTEPLKYFNFGFLCFDSPEANLFRGMPDIFDYRDRFHKYLDLLRQNATFHLGASIADTMSMFLRNVYRDQGGSHAAQDILEPTSELSDAGELGADHRRLNSDADNRGMLPSNEAPKIGG